MADHNGALIELLTAHEAKLLTSWLRIQVTGVLCARGKSKKANSKNSLGDFSASLCRR